MQLTILTEQYPFFIIGGIDDFMIDLIMCGPSIQEVSYSTVCGECKAGKKDEPNEPF